MFLKSRNVRNLKFNKLVLFLGLIFIVTIVLSGVASAATAKGTVKNTTTVKSEGVPNIIPSVSASPPGGTFPESVTVSLGGNTAGTIYYYTYNPALVPSIEHTWHTYTGPLTFTQNTAIDFYKDSGLFGTTSIHTEKYYITHITPSVSASPKGGTYDNTVTVTLSGTNVDTIIYETWDPNSNINVVNWKTYTGSLTFTKDTAIDFYGTGSYGTTSTYTEKYYINKVTPTVWASPKGGTFNNNVKVTLNGNYVDRIDYYTYDPHTGMKESDWQKYTGPLTFTKDTAINFCGTGKFGDSLNIIEKYYINNPPLPYVYADPEIGVDGYAYFLDSVTVTLVGKSVDTIKYHTYNPSNPPKVYIWQTYTGPLTFTSNTAIDFYGTGPKGTTSVSTAKYDITTVNASPKGGKYNKNVIVTLSGHVINIYYVALDPSYTGKFTWKIYTGPITITKNTALSFYGTSEFGNTKTKTEKYYIIASLDKTPPKIISSVPAFSVPISNSITQLSFKFSENVIPKSMWISIIGSGQTIPFTWKVNGKVLTLTLKSKLKKGIHYTVTLHTGAVTDKASNKLAAKTISFTTKK